MSDTVALPVAGITTQTTDAVGIAAVAEPTAAVATTTGGSKKPFSIARRINEGGRDRLTALGVDFLGEKYQYFTVQVPSDWELRDTTASPYQKRLYDGAGNLIAQCFFGSCGGTPSIKVFLTDEEAKAMEPA